MKILFLGIEFDCKNYVYKVVYDEESFYNEVLFKHYDVLIINFNFLSAFLEIKTYFKGVVIFISNFIDELTYKKVLEIGDFFYTFDEMWKIKYRLKYIADKYFDLKKNIFIYKELIYNLKTKELYKNRNLIKLSPAEREILNLLILNKKNFISKEFILENSNYIKSMSSIKVLISKLRKIGFNIENQKKFGYKIKEEK